MSLSTLRAPARAGTAGRAHEKWLPRKAALPPLAGAAAAGEWLSAPE
jgi:hypothetical protein